MDQPPNEQDRQPHGGNVPIQQVPEHQPSAVHPDMRVSSYPTRTRRGIDIQGARIVRNHRLEELVNTAFTSPRDSINTTSANNTIPTGPRAMNRARNQAIPATTPLQQQYFSRYPISEPRLHRRGGSLGDIPYQISHQISHQISQHQHHGQGPSRIPSEYSQGPSRIPSQPSTISHASYFQPFPSEYLQNSGHHISHVPSHSYSHPSTTPYQESHHPDPSRTPSGYSHGFNRYHNSHEAHLHQRTGSLGDVPYQISQHQQHGVGQGPSRHSIPSQTSTNSQSSSYQTHPSGYSQYPTHQIPHIPTHSHSHSHSHSHPYTTPTQTPHFIASLFQTALSFQPSQTPRPTHPPRPATTQPSSSFSYPLPSNPVLSNPSHPSSSNPLSSHHLPLSSYPLGPLSSIPLSSIPLPSTYPIPPFLQRNLDQCAPYLSPPRDDDDEEESDPDFERESIKTRFGPVVCKPVPEFLMASMERTGSGRVFWRVSGSGPGSGSGDGVDRNRSSTSPAHLRRRYSQSSVYVPPPYSQQDQAGPSTSHSHVYNHEQFHSHSHPEPQPPYHHQQGVQQSEFTPLITEIITGYVPPASVSPSRATFSFPSSSPGQSSAAQAPGSASVPPTTTTASNPPQGSQELQQPETLQIFDFDSATSAMRSYFRALPNNAPSTDPALSPYSPLISGVIVLWDNENTMNLRVRCLGLFVDGMGRPVGLGQRKVSGGSGKESSSGSDTIKAGEVGQVQPEKSALEAPEVEQGERGAKGKGKGKEKEKESGNGGGENNSSRRNERVFFRPVLIDGFPLGYVPLVYRQIESEEVMRDQAMGIRMVMFRPRAGQGQVQTGSVMGGGGGGGGGDGVGEGMMVPQAEEQRDQAVQEWLEAEAMSIDAWQERMGNPEW